MTHEQLREIQERIRFDSPSMAACLGVTVRAYRNYLYGANSIPPVVARAALELEQVNIQFIQDAPRRIDDRINREFPYGFVGEFEAESL